MTGTDEAPHPSKESKKARRASSKQLAKMSNEERMHVHYQATGRKFPPSDDLKAFLRVLEEVLEDVKTRLTPLEDPGQAFWDTSEGAMLEGMYARELVFRGTIVCGACGAEQHESKFSRCGGCEAEFYCSRECQRNDWGNSHKGSCSVMKAVKAARRKKWYDEEKQMMLAKYHAWKIFAQRNGLSSPTVHFQPDPELC